MLNFHVGHLILALPGVMWLVVYQEMRRTHLAPPQRLLALSVARPRDAGCVLHNRLGPARRKNLLVLSKRVVISAGHTYISAFKTQFASEFKVDFKIHVYVHIK